MENQVRKAIRETFQQHRRRYGVRRLVVELQEKGMEYWLLPGSSSNAKGWMKGYPAP